jgi:hypothetical protein
MMRDEMEGKDYVEIHGLLRHLQALNARFAKA